MAIEITEATGEDTQDRLIGQRDHARDDTQKWVDEKVKGLIDRYHEAGDPAPSRKAPYLRLEVKKEDRGDLRRMINRAFTFYSSNDAQGKEVPNLVGAFYQDGKGADGKVSVKFNVQPKPLTKAEREAKEAAEKEAAEKASEESQEPPGDQPQGDQPQEQEPQQGDAQDAPSPGRLAGLRGRGRS